jgi:WD40 repeat protein
LWDTSGKQLDQFKLGKTKSGAWRHSPDSPLIATGGYDGTVRLWKLMIITTLSSVERNQNPSLDSEQSKTQLQNDMVYSVAFINKDKM